MMHVNAYQHIQPGHKWNSGLFLIREDLLLTEPQPCYTGSNRTALLNCIMNACTHTCAQTHTQIHPRLTLNKGIGST